MRLLAALIYLSGIVVATPSFALEPNFSIQQGVLKYGSGTTKTTPDGGSSSKTDSTKMETMANSLILFATMEKFAVYVLPTQANLPVSVGYYVMPELEVGLNIALNSTLSDNKDDVKTESSDNSYGPYVTYYRSAGTLQLEFNYSLSLVSSTSKTTKNDDTKAVSNETDISGMSHYLSAMGFYPLAKNLLYGAGVEYSMSSTKDSKGSKNKEESSGFNLNLVTFRFNF